MKQIIFAGPAAEELPIYIATLLNNGGHKSAIVDHSRDAVGNHTLICMLDDPNEKGQFADSVERGPIKIYTSEKMLSNEKYRLDYYGENISGINTENAYMTILCTDMYAFNARKLARIKEITKKEVPVEQEANTSTQDKKKKNEKKKKKDSNNNKNENVILFINNYTSLKYGEKYIKTVSRHPEASVIKHLHNIGDLSAKLGIGYEKIDITKLSAEFKAQLMEIYLKLTGEEENKKLAKALWR